MASKPLKDSNPALYAAMLAAFCGGMSEAKLAKGFNCSRTTVVRVASENGWVAQRTSFRKRLERRAKTTQEEELATNLKILRDLRNVVNNKIVGRIGKDGKGDLGVPVSEQVPLLLSLIKEQMRLLGFEDKDGPGGGINVNADNVAILLNMPKKQQQEIEQKLLDDLGMMDPAKEPD